MKAYQKELERLMFLFDRSFINSQNELILVPKLNLYFRLEDVNTINDLKAKLIAWVSRSACNLNYYFQEWRNKKYEKDIRYKMNEFLGVEFNNIQYMFIYQIFGNMVNKEKLYEWLGNNLDFNKLDLEEYNKTYNLLVNERGFKVE